MSRRRVNDTEAPGQDSFLDVVANLVGVLIILVMVVGTQAKNAIVAVSTAVAADDTKQEEVAKPDVDAALQDMRTVEKEIADIVEKTQREQFEVAYRKQERDRLLLLMTAAEKEIELNKQKLSKEDREEIDTKVRLTSAFQELSDLENALAGLSENEKPVEVVKHYPTPMAKTVFGKEAHFRLQNGKLTYVPFDEFVTRLKEDAPKQMWKLKDTDRIAESIGPLQGFLMRYTLKKEVVTGPSGGSMTRGEKAVLENFILIPTTENMGEPVEQALGPNSEFRSMLAQYNPKQYTVTLWVYPDSFHQFRQVRDSLLKLGFITAGRPMPEGHPIGGSPEGSRSAAQ